MLISAPGTRFSTGGGASSRRTLPQESRTFHSNKLERSSTKKMQTKLTILRVWSAVWGSDWIRSLFHVISNKPMNGFSWMHGTVLLIPARLYSLHNRWWHHTGEWHRDYPARHWRIYLPRFVCFPQASCSCYFKYAYTTILFIRCFRCAFLAVFEVNFRNSIHTFH